MAITDAMQKKWADQWPWACFLAWWTTAIVPGWWTAEAMIERAR